MSGMRRKKVKLLMTGSVRTGPTAFSPYLQSFKYLLCKLLVYPCAGANIACNHANSFDDYEATDEIKCS